MNGISGFRNKIVTISGNTKCIVGSLLPWQGHHCLIVTCHLSTVIPGNHYFRRRNRWKSAKWWECRFFFWYKNRKRLNKLIKRLNTGFISQFPTFSNFYKLFNIKKIFLDPFVKNIEIIFKVWFRHFLGLGTSSVALFDIIESNEFKTLSIMPN